MLKSAQKFFQSVTGPIFINSYWGIMSQVFQSILLSLFFILVARNFTTNIFANFIIATALYQLIASFSSLGLSQWFIREITGVGNKKDLISKFFKIQIYSGVVFYLLNIILGFLIYDDKHIQILTILLGINIIFDNIINAIKCINISEFEQRKTFLILLIDAFLKFSAACFLYVYPFSIITFSIILVSVRFVTLNLFLRIGSSRLINIMALLKYKVSVSYLGQLIRLNWPFIIIGSVSIINWRIATIIISKTLTSIDVANYEISFRLFSLVAIMPIVVSTTIFPILIKYFKEGNVKEFNAFYKEVHLYYLLFGLFSFTFIYSFADFFITIIFGLKYVGASYSTKAMFLTILVMPTGFLQANVLVAMKFEKLDMWFNIASLITFLIFCLFGLYYIKSLLVINLSIFIGFIFFHILQDFALVKRRVCSRIHVLEFYILSIISVTSYILLQKLLNPVALFLGFWIVMLSIHVINKKLRGINKIKLIL